MAKIELAQAFVTIIPSMDGSQTSIMELFDDVPAAAEDTGQQTGAKFAEGVNAKVTAAKTLIAAGMIKAFDKVTSSIGTAAERLDIIKAYPKTMQALGYAADDAQKSIKSMNDHLVGLPTATADIIGFVKGIAAAGVPLKEATDLGLAFNDMMLAGGASADATSRAMVQYNQMLGKGKVDMESWNSIAEVVPGQLNLVAESLMGAGAKHQDLYAALQDGTITFDEFNQAIIKCAQEGGEEFESFATSAKLATGGITTAWNLMSSRIANGLVEIMDQIGQERISGFLDKVSTKFLVIAEKAAPVLADIAIKILDVGEKLLPLLDYLPEIAAGIIAIKAAWGTVNLLAGVSEAAEGIGKLKDGVHASIEVFGNAKAGVGLLAEAVGGKLAVAMRWAAKGASYLFDVLMAHPILLVVAAVATLAYALYEFFTKTEEGRAMWASFVDGITQRWEEFKVFMDVACATIAAAWQTLVDTGASLWTGFCDIVKAIGNGLLVFIQAGLTMIEETANAIWTALKFVFVLHIELFKATLIAFFNGVKAILDGIQVAWTATCNGLKVVWTGLMTALKAIWTGFVNVFKAGVAAIKALWTGFCNVLRTLWTNLSNAIVSIFNQAGTGVKAAIGAIKTAFERSVQMIKAIWSSGCALIKSVITALVNFIKALVPGDVGGAFDDAKDRAVSAFTAIKDKAAAIVRRIKSIFNFSWSIPKPRIPKINVDGGKIPWGIGGKGRMPSISFGGWYAKGGVFNAPSLIGVGEAGPEAAMPLKAIKPYFHEAAQAEGMRGNTYNIAKIEVLAKDLDDMQSWDDFCDRAVRKLRMGEVV